MGEPMTDQGEILVTGGSGYIAAGASRGCSMTAGACAPHPQPGARGRGAPRAGHGGAGAGSAELLRRRSHRDEGWADAARGCRYLLHVASPLGVENPRDPDVLVRPARDGAVRAISAAIRQEVERVVITSSVAAMRVKTPNGPIDESNWTDPATRAHRL